MDEQTIADDLKQNLPQPYKTDIAPTTVDTTQGQATVAVSYEMDELTQYKLCDYFDQPYRAYDGQAKHQLQYIYAQVINMVEEKEIGFILSKIKEIEQRLGANDNGRRIYRLYQWLKLDSLRRNAEAQQGALTHG